MAAILESWRQPALILVTLPMALGRGLGAELRNGVGIASAGGILVSGLLTLLVMPPFYNLFTRGQKPPAPDDGYE